MESLLEVNPPACVFVVGPRLAADVAASPSLGYGHTVREVVAAALESEQAFAAEEELKRLAQGLMEACRQNPGLAARDAVEMLKRRGRYGVWLQRTFGGGPCNTDAGAGTRSGDDAVHAQERKPAARGLSSAPGLKLLLHLQQRGALLVYTHCDTVLDDVAGTTPVLMSERANFHKWAVGEVAGFLHVNGVYSQPESVLLDGATYDHSLAQSMPAAYATLKKILKHRLTIFVGFREDSADALLMQKMLLSFYSDEGSVRNPPILLTAPVSRQTNREAVGTGDGFLRLCVPADEVQSLDALITVGSEKNFAIGMWCHQVLCLRLGVPLIAMDVLRCTWVYFASISYTFHVLTQAV